ncbi:MAG: hypothetical protein AAB582_00870 [Patescibacteria group bacterium]
MKKLLLGAVAAAAAIVVPGISFAATFAYVNQSGEVMTTESPSAMQALTTAPGIDEHSGVMLITTTSDEVVGDDVPGV